MTYRLQRGAVAAIIALAVLLAGATPHTTASAEPRPAPRLLRSDSSGATVELRIPGLALAADGSLSIAGATDQPAGALPTFYAALGAPPGASVSLVVADAELRPLPAGAQSPVGLVFPAAGCAPGARLSGDAWMRGQRIVPHALDPVLPCPDGSLRWRSTVNAEIRWEGGNPLAPAPADPLLDTALAASLLNYEQARAWRVVPTAPTLSAEPALRARLSVVGEGFYSVGYSDLQAAGLPVDSLDPRSFSLSTRGAPVAITVSGEADGRFDPGDSLSFYGQPLDNRPILDSVILNGTLVVTATSNSQAYSEETLYGDRNVYWLDFGGQPGPRMGALAATPDPSAPSPTSFRHTVRAEESLWWWTWHFTSRETWFWTRSTTTGVLTDSFSIALPAPDPTGAPAALSAEMVALTHNPSVAPDHRTRLAFNGQLVDDATWDGPSRFAAQADIPASTLLAGQNQLDLGMLRQPGIGADTLYFDFFTLTYSRLFRAESDQLRFDVPAGAPQRFQVSGLSGPQIRVFDVADPAAPRLLSGIGVTQEGATYSVSFSPPGGGGRFLVVGPGGERTPIAVQSRTPSGLRSSANGADYIIVAPAALRTAAESIAAYRVSRGMRVVVADLDAIIDEFNAGIYHPIAIKRFLAHAYAAWQAPAPQYALLLGEGHFNFRGYSPGRYGSGGPILMPPNLAWVDPFQGQVDSSNQLVTFAGDDLLPDMAIGRLTARNSDDVAAFLAKTAAHEQAPADAPWRNRLLFVADNGPDPAGDFAVTLDQVIADTVPAAAFSVERLYLDELCGPTQSPAQACPRLTSALTATLNVSGTFMLTYSGHGAIPRWSHEGILNLASIASLTNADRPPFVVSLACLDGFWTFPGNESLSETMVRMAGGGAAVTFSPTGLGVATGHEQLQRGLHQALFAGGPKRLGPVTLAAKLALFSSGIGRDLVDTYTIFGDPAINLALPRALTELPVTPTPTTPTPTTPTPEAQRRLYLPLTRAGQR